MQDFETLGLSPQIVEAVKELGFVKPTPIQQEAIPHLLENSGDLVGLAQTGTGKTAAFGLPMLHLVDSSKAHPQGLVLAPTRELCLQITSDLKKFAKHTRNLRVTAIYGGADIMKQIREVKKGVQVVVATPGRLRDMIKRRAVNLSSVSYVVLDEADEMLNMGFKEEIDDILSNTPDTKATWLFSATMPSEVRRIARNYMTDPFELTVGHKNSSNVDIDHQYVLVRRNQRYDTLKRFLDFEANAFGLIFCRTRMDTKKLADQLTQDGYNADAIHGDLNQSQRDRVMGNFRSRRLQVLVATDVAARGIDVQEITHVFHYNIPDDLSFYTHRAGRTGRAGKKGISLVLADPRDKSLLRRLERVVRINFTPARIPTGQEICEGRLLSYIRNLKEVKISEGVGRFLPAILKELEEVSKEELVEKLASLSFSRFLENYRHSPDLNTKSKDRHKQTRTARMKRIFINIGSMDVVDKAGFLSLICSTAKISGQAIGKIDLRRMHTFFDVEEDSAKMIYDEFNDSVLKDRSIRVNEDTPRASDRRGKKYRGDKKDWKSKKPKKFKKKPRF